MRNIATDGFQTAFQVCYQFATADILLIARKIGVKITYENWFPITYGEFDRINKTIIVNLNAKENCEKIIAHELGHFFAENLNLGKAEEEVFAHEFAAYFVKTENNL
jgi:Zn-dependent peptidase ImmA (M78 family)